MRDEQRVRRGEEKTEGKQSRTRKSKQKSKQALPTGGYVCTHVLVGQLEHILEVDASVGVLAEGALLAVALGHPAAAGGGAGEMGGGE